MDPAPQNKTKQNKKTKSEFFSMRYLPLSPRACIKFHQFERKDDADMKLLA